MKLIIGIIGIIWAGLAAFLWLIVKSASRSIDDETQAMLDDEQTAYIKEYFDKKKKQTEKKTRESDSEE